MRRVGDDDGAGRRGFENSRGEVRRPALRGVLPRLALIDGLTDDDFARRDRDSSLELEPAFDRNLRHRSSDSQSREDSALRCVLVRLRIAEVREQAVALVALDVAVVTLDVL